MGKRSEFERRKADRYFTPAKAVLPLLPYLPPATRFVEPCAGDRRLARHLERHGHQCVAATDLEPSSLFVSRADALSLTVPPGVVVITNPPWSRPILHPLIEHFRQQAPTWLLFDADWMHTIQARPHWAFCTHIVSVGRVRWIEGTSQDGKDNAAWYRFTGTAGPGPRFFGR